MQRLPAGSNVEVGKENIIFVKGGNADELDVYRINDDFSLTRLSTIKDREFISVDYVGIHGDEIYIYLVFKIENIFRANESFYYSSDRGRNWNKLGSMGLSRYDSHMLTSYVDDDGFKIVYNDGFSLNIFWN